VVQNVHRRLTLNDKRKFDYYLTECNTDNITNKQSHK